MAADVFDITTKRRRPIPVAEYVEMLNTMQKYFNEARRLRGKSAFKQSEDILKEIRFCAQCGSGALKFRESTRDELKDILDEVYENFLDH